MVVVLSVLVVVALFLTCTGGDKNEKKRVYQILEHEDTVMMGRHCPLMQTMTVVHLV